MNCRVRRRSGVAVLREAPAPCAGCLRRCYNSLGADASSDKARQSARVGWVRLSGPFPNALVRFRRSILSAVRHSSALLVNSAALGELRIVIRVHLPALLRNENLHETVSSRLPFNGVSTPQGPISPETRAMTNEACSSIGIDRLCLDHMNRL